MEYLFSEVLARLPNATQAFLMQTAILERLSGPLCDALSNEGQPTEAGQRHLEWLERENIFTVALDEQGLWFRYHHLFQRLLQGQLARHYRAEEIAALHSRASVWYGTNGFIEDALHHALTAGDKPGAAHLVETHRHAAMNHSQFQRMEQWLHLLPPQLIAERPGLLLLEAWIMQYHWQLADLPPHLDRIEALLAQMPLPEPEGKSLRSEIDALRSYVCFYATDGKEALALAGLALQHAPMAHSAVRGFAWGIYIGALQLQGDFRGAQNALYASLDEDRYHGNTFPISPLIAHCTVGWMAGDLTAMQQSALRLQQLAHERNLPGNHAWAHHFLGCAAYQLNDLVSAEREFDSVVSKRRNAHGHAFWQGALGLASVYLAQGENERAHALGVSLQATAWEMGSAGAMRDAQALQAFLALRLGRQAEAQRWAAAYDRSRPLMPMPMFYAAPLLLAKILLDQASPQSLADVDSWLRHLYEFVVTTHNTRFQIEVLALQALLHEARGEKTAALEALVQAVHLAEPGSLLRVFLDLGQPMAALLARLVARGDAPGFAHKLLHAFPTPAALSLTPAPFAGPSTLVEPLTRREQEVLHLLAQRRTAGEIALQLVISEKTVKRHTANIYQKLGVNRRKDALTAAQVAGVLPNQ
jgi:LuxR family maltose regulon positive regulatory protein